MVRQDDSIRDLLLARLPRPEGLAAYQEQVKSLLERNEKALRQKKWTVVRVWIFVVAVSIPGLWMAGTHFNTPQGNWFLALTLFWVLFGALEVAKYAIDQAKVELLKEVKQLQLQVLEIHARLSEGGIPMSEKS
jgi:hypothetical protein